jgi:hypothetical protein
MASPELDEEPKKRPGGYPGHYYDDLVLSHQNSSD